MIELNIKKSLFNETFIPIIEDKDHRVLCLMGSAGSGKSMAICQKLIIRCCQEKIRILVCRRYATTIRQTVFALFKEVLAKWKLTPYIKVNESDYRIKFPNESEIIFTGLDEETKLLSLQNIGSIWVEEAYEVPKDLYEQLNLRMRSDISGQQIILSFNPISANSWLKDLIDNPPESFLYHHSTFRDNKFLNKEYIKTLEELYIRNPQKARIYCDGEWGIEAEGLVFTNWKIDKLDATQLSKLFEHKCGADFGYHDPTAIVESFYDEEDKTIYVTGCFYRTGQTLDNMYDAICNMNLQKSKIICDSAEPRTIDYLVSKGVNAVPCVKGPDSVEARYTFLQNHLIVVDESVTDLITELSNFSYIKDKKTGKYSDKVTHEFSHGLDALGYSYSDLYTQQKLRVFDKSILGL